VCTWAEQHTPDTVSPDGLGLNTLRMGVALRASLEDLRPPYLLGYLEAPLHTADSAQKIYVVIVRIPTPAQQSAKLSKPLLQRGQGPKRGRSSVAILPGLFKSRVLCVSEMLDAGLEQG